MISTRITHKFGFWSHKRLVEVILVGMVLTGGLLLRLINLTDPPVSPHGWRQLRSASIARMFYFDRLPGVDEGTREQAHYMGAVYQVMEPLILENLTATTYLAVGGEFVWIARLYNIIFWMLGGVALYFMTRRGVSVAGGLAAVAFYLFLPFGVSHSRIFMPDVLMVSGVVVYACLLFMWSETKTWGWALAAGLMGGVAILVKVFAVFPVALSLGLLALTTFGIAGTLRRLQFWSILGIMVLVPSIYYLVSMPGRAGDYLNTWTIPYLHLLLDPWFYVRWLHRLNTLFNVPFLLAGFIGTILMSPRARALSIGLWVGYLLIGLSVPSLIRSHSYYNLALIPAVAFGLAGIGDLLYRQMDRVGWVWRVMVVGVLLVGLADAAYLGRKEITEASYPQEPAFWKELAQRIPLDGDIVGLTEDYNARMNYYGMRYIKYYPYSFDQAMGELAGASFTSSDGNRQYFLDKVGDARYFLITMMEELNAQPYLKNILDNYQLVIQGERFRLYDLTKPK